jgi:hypothetical protein
MYPSRRFGALLVLLFAVLLGAADPKPKPAEKLLFDFESAADLKVWSNLALPGAKVKEPAARFERSRMHATSGKHSLKITFAGGSWPTLTTTAVGGDWLAYHTFRADVTVSRPCVVGFTALQEKSRRGTGWDPGISRWTKTYFCKPGLNRIRAALQPYEYGAIHKKFGKVVRFEVFMYNPRAGESIYLDNVRLSTARTVEKPVKTTFRVLGTDLVVKDVRELGKKLKARWKKPTTRTVAQVEEAFRARYAELKKKHPRAVLAVLRDGEKGYDPREPAKVYAGWKDAYWSSHGPDGLTVERADNRGKDATHEVFMRHRSPLMRVELSSIPRRSKVLAAQLVLVRAGGALKEHNAEVKPTMWAAEACNRPWQEYEVNAYQYARDKFWKDIGGWYYGKDPDFLPVYLAHGPGSGRGANVWDFTHAVAFWTDGKHPNHGFMLHGDSHDYLRAFTREAKNVKDRPALLVIYEPPGK